MLWIGISGSFGALPNHALRAAQVTQKTRVNRSIHDDEIIRNKKALYTDGSVAHDISSAGKDVKSTLAEDEKLVESRAFVG